ncbi:MULTISPECIES: hypothetical protein [Gammaproteobacteria]|uniref:hypothetical protein n=1 Tax=Gammaproteobacteria TaxID=1236 RepID=UPI000DCFAC6E|nr:MULTISPECIES: hypothetical protein [Gammaproteobacteria]RTE86448.1 hypothetical protein DQX04_07785 [Aliidiomarina sp. B3213]TCZ90997.1 hypothetical protein EYQ95_09260 [Lysobacter sp. N42]
MKKLMIIGVVALMSVGCASTNSSSAFAKKYEVDWDEVAVIEAANRNGASPSRVIWVNPPMKRVQDDSDASPQPQQ